MGRLDTLTWLTTLDLTWQFCLFLFFGFIVFLEIALGPEEPVIPFIKDTPHGGKQSSNKGLPTLTFSFQYRRGTVPNITFFLHLSFFSTGVSNLSMLLWVKELLVSGGSLMTNFSMPRAHECDWFCGKKAFFKWSKLQTKDRSNCALFCVPCIKIFLVVDSYCSGWFE